VSITDGDLFGILAALAILLGSANLFARMFKRFRQPPVIGEILGGLLLGPTLFGMFAPEAQAWLFPRTGAVASGLGLVGQIGMLLLMFLAGAEMRTVFSRHDGRMVGMIAVAGIVVPLAGGVLFAWSLDGSGLIGPANDSTALGLVLISSLAVTSIPVIARIMLDLGIMQTVFARVVLSVAVLEDIVLNVLLAVALGMVSHAKQDAFGLSTVLQLSSTTESIAYHTLASIGFLLLVYGVSKVRRPARRLVSDRAADQVAIRIVLTLGVAASCVLLGLAPIFGAFAVGLLTDLPRTGSESMTVIRSFASGFFIPIYFAIVGLKLDLVHGFALWFTIGFILLACALKIVGVFVGARLAGSPAQNAINLAVAMNARGGPGIVMATLAFDAGIVSQQLFTTLVLTAIATSLLAGSWLERALARGQLMPKATESDPALVSSAS
jgi:Kef-type K+ transport system membrane component KefB